MTTAVSSRADDVPLSAVDWRGRDRVTLLQFVTVFGLGGTERHLVNLSRGLDRSLFDLQLACMNRWGYFLKEFEEQNIPISEYPVHNLYGAGSVRQRRSTALRTPSSKPGAARTPDGTRPSKRWSVMPSCGTTAPWIGRLTGAPR